MKNVDRTRRLVLFCLLVTALSTAAALVTEKTPGVPTVFNRAETPFQNQTHFLNFIQLGSPESAASATAYYNAVDPTATKRTFQQWLVSAGFISDVSQWHPTGAQAVACDLGTAAGCDVTKHNPDGSLRYGDNIINTDSHAIVLNAADLGFVRNQYIRCVPSCNAPNPLIYTYLENYPVNAFAASGNSGSGFPILTGYPSTAEAAAAMESALNRPLGKLATNPLNGQPCNDDQTMGTVTTDTFLGCSIQRIADVAFEWTPAPGKTSGTKYGKLYSFIFSADGSGIGDSVHTQETITVPPTGFAPNLADGNHFVLNYSTSGLTPISATDPFPPNLDFIGFKYHPGVCFICHGGAPPALVNGVYPNQGNVNGFRLLPLDIRNLMFSSDSGGEQPALGTSIAYTDRVHQEAQIMLYNLAVLLTVNQTPQSDGSGTVRPPHLAEVINGWYAGGSPTQNGSFLPVGWREPPNGTAPAGSEQLYTQVVAPFCRSCHFNREISLDFGTAANFRKEPDDIFGFAVRSFCQQSNPPKGKKVMPLAHLTYQRYWQANSTAGVDLPYPSPGLHISNAVEQLAYYFGYAGTAGWCARQN